MAVDYSEQRDYFEGLTQRRHPDHPAVQLFARHKRGFILEALPPTERPYTMLEVGAGNGYFSASFDEAFELTCLDFSPNMLAQNPVPEGQKIVGDAEDLPFDDDSYDVVFCGNLLHHLTDPSVAVAEMKRVAQRHVVLLEPNSLNPLMLAFGALVPEERGLLKFTPAYIKSLGRAAGMTLRAFTSQGLVLPNRTPASWVPALDELEARAHGKLGFYHIAVFDV